jgi:gluconate kinase
MAAGVPLTNEDRWHWLGAIAAWTGERVAAGESGVAQCSALKRAYRGGAPWTGISACGSCSWIPVMTST